MQRIIVSLFIAFFSLTVHAAKPQKAPASPDPAVSKPTNALDPAWQEIEKKVIAIVGQKGQRTIVDIAYAEVGADACPGLKINGKAFNESFDALIEDPEHKRSPEQQRALEHQSMAYIGVYVGLLLSESFGDRDRFCKEVDVVKTTKAGPSKFWTAK